MNGDDVNVNTQMTGEAGVFILDSWPEDYVSEEIMRIRTVAHFLTYEESRLSSSTLLFASGMA